jgi:ADP-ribose pyrophosphatase YjhB (NUDIX family)
VAEAPPVTNPRELRPDTVRFCPLCGASVVRRVVSSDMREHPVCEGCGFVCYLHPKLVAITIPVRDGRVLLARRAIEPAHGLWTFPGGYVDWGEDVAAAARREMREEVGLDLAPAGLVGIYSYADAPVVIVAYHVIVPPSLEAAADSHEVSEIRYFTREEIPWHALAFRSTREALGDWFGRPGV